MPREPPATMATLPCLEMLDIDHPCSCRHGSLHLYGDLVERRQQHLVVLRQTDRDAQCRLERPDQDTTPQQQLVPGSLPWWQCKDEVRLTGEAAETPSPQLDQEPPSLAALH